MKVFIVLQWFYDGDSYLVDSFVGVKSTYEKAKSLLDKNDTILKNEDFEIYNNKRTPNDWGNYGSDCKYEIREVEV